MERPAKKIKKDSLIKVVMSLKGFTYDLRLVPQQTACGLNGGSKRRSEWRDFLSLSYCQILTQETHNIYQNGLRDCLKISFLHTSSKPSMTGLLTVCWVKRVGSFSDISLIIRNRFMEFLQSMDDSSLLLNFYCSKIRFIDRQPIQLSL